MLNIRRQRNNSKKKATTSKWEEIRVYFIWIRCCPIRLGDLGRLHFFLHKNTVIAHIHIEICSYLDGDAFKPMPSLLSIFNSFSFAHHIVKCEIVILYKHKQAKPIMLVHRALHMERPWSLVAPKVILRRQIVRLQIDVNWLLVIRGISMYVDDMMVS